MKLPRFVIFMSFPKQSSTRISYFTVVRLLFSKENVHCIYGVKDNDMLLFILTSTIFCQQTT